MKIGGINKFSLIDYPEKVSAVIFTQGCNFRCPYCHNPELLEAYGPPCDSDESDPLSFLESRKKMIDAVVISGGEPTLQKRLISFIKNVKKMGFLVKLDTNGSNPKVLEQIISEKIVDYIAMDYKAPLEIYPKLARTELDISDIAMSAKLLIKSDVDYEFRTTISKGLLTENCIISIFNELKNAKRLVIQKVESRNTLNKTIKFGDNYTNKEFHEFKKLAEYYVKECHVR